MTEKYHEKIKKHKSNCEKILKLSNEIRYVGVINEFGRTLTGKIQRGIKPLFSPDQMRNELFAISSMMKLRNSSINSLGQIKYMLIKHSRVQVLLFINVKVTYYVSIDRNVKSIEKMVKEIQNII